tara:strand:+ start:104 stop:1168 length:1065 start_codon:yes stop_codon:yes gene_type:complete
MRILLITIILTANLSHPLFAKIASVIGDPLSKEIYFEVNKDTKNYPASLTKIMTLYIIFDQLAQKRLNLNDRVYFSKHATYQQPSKLGIAEKDFITVDELIDSLIVKSANDSAIAIAEKISGNEKEFVIKMNEYAKVLDLQNTNFANPHGLPNRSNLSTAYDIFKLSSKIIIDFPEHLHRFKKKKIKIKGKSYKTHNTLLKKYDHYVGLKTGYTRKSGFQISLLSINENDYLLGIYFGGNSAKERNNKINFLMNKYSIKNGQKNNDFKKENFKNDVERTNTYLIQTSSFKKISKSKKHIILLKNNLKILRGFEHQIKKNGSYFISFINVEDQKLAKIICNEIKLKKLDCLIKAS